MRVKKDSVIIMLLFAVIIQPDLFSQIRPLFLLFSGFNIIIFLYFFANCFKAKNIPSIMYIWFATQFYLLCLMIFNGNISDIDNWGRTTIVISNAFLVMHWYCLKGKACFLLNSISNLGLIYLTINAVTVFLFPNGVVTSIGGAYFFLGTRNILVQYLFPFIAASGLLFIYTRKKIRLVLTIILSVSNIIRFDISTAITCACVIVVLLLFHKRFNMLKLKHFLVVSMALNIMFITLNASSIFSWFIINILRKDIGLNSRTLIWNVAVDMIFQTKVGFIFGHGIVNDGRFVRLYELDWPAHNQLLDWIYSYGVIGITGMIKFLLGVDKNDAITSDYYYLRTLCFSILIGCIASGLLKSIGGFIPFILLFFLPIIQKQFDEHEFRNRT